MVSESDCSAKEKRKRIVESLKGPALEVVKAVRANNTDATALEYIEALESAFCTSESGEDLYFAFRLLRQEPGEALSDFLRRQERSLTLVIKRGGLSPQRADRARVEQLLRGAVESDLMLLKLRLHERKENPPTFLRLLNEIREEEENEAARRKLGVSVKEKTAKDRVRGSLSNRDNFKVDAKELRLQLGNTSLSRPSERDDDKSKTEARPSENPLNAEVLALKAQVEQLQKQLSVLSIGASSQNTPEFLVGRGSIAPIRSAGKSSDGFFCYNCGGDGHIASRCEHAANSALVIQKLLQLLRKSKEKKPASGQRNTEVRKSDCFSKKSLLEVPEPSLVPAGLVGPSSTVEVKVNGQPCLALLDSGSQVTIVFEKWYLRHLPQVPLNHFDGLAIWGLSSASYPYRGYIVVDMEFPQALMGSTEVMSVLALVCPDPVGPEQTPVILGTNASFFQRLVDICTGSPEPKTSHVLRIQSQWITDRLVPSSEIAAPEEKPVGEVKWSGENPLTLPPQTETCVVGHIDCQSPLEKDIYLVEGPEEDVLPAGVLVPPVVVPFSAMKANQLKVLVRNDTFKEKLIPNGTVLARVYATDTVRDARAVTEDHQILDPELFDFGNSPVPQTWKDRLRQKLSERVNVFSLSDIDVGLAQGVKHNIRLRDDTPFRERSRRIAPADVEDVRRHLKNLMTTGIIKESRSPYASPIVIARKRNGDVRMCVDYRTLNSRTIPDQYTTPRIDDALDCLAGSQWFSVLDLRSGYYQIEMAEEDKEKTAFICPLGFFQFERMPQGITGAPATFQRLMERAIGDMHLLEAIVYLDDIIVFGRTLEQHEERLFKVLDRLEECGLKVSIDKCQFCQPEVKYVGHMVSAEGIAADPGKIEAVAKWKQPHDLKSLRSFLGFCGYYRRFIKGYSSVVRPLTDLTKGYPPAGKGKTKPKTVAAQGYFKEAEPFGDRWTTECTEAFREIIYRLTHAPVLAFADPSRPYILHVDASMNGLGAVLNQEYPDGLRPVAYASRKLSETEKRYTIHQLEFLALKWAVVDKFHDYLYGVRFTVRTDNNPLTYVLSSAKLNATGHRWLAALATYEFTIQYKPGRINTDADLLSRNPHDDPAPDKWTEIAPSGVKALGGESLELLSLDDLRGAQDTDAVIGVVKRELETGNVVSTVKGDSPAVTLLQRQRQKLRLLDNVLHRVTQTDKGEERTQLVLPEVYRQTVLRSLHDESGHLGIDKTKELITDRFYWPKMGLDIESYVKNCGRCIARKTIPQRAAPLNQLTSRGPLDLVCIDFLSLEPDSKGFANVLVITDHYTRYAQAYPTRDQKATTVAKVLFEKFFVHYGLPARVHSDQGRDFECQLIQEFLRMLGIRKSRTTPYHPQGDPQPERFNRTLLSMLGTLESAKRQRWSQYVASLVHAYNCTFNEATGYSPYFLLFGREARLPIDVCFGLFPHGKENTTHTQYVQKLKADLQEAYELASAAALRNHQKNKTYYDRRVRHQVLAKGDRVLVRNVGLKGKHKLQDKWCSVPHLVVEQLPNLPVYRVKPENGFGRERTLHRDHLLPIGEFVRFGNSAVKEKVSRKPVTRAERARRESTKASRTEAARLPRVSVDFSVSSSSSEDEVYYGESEICQELLDSFRKAPEHGDSEPVALAEDNLSVSEQSDVEEPPVVPDEMVGNNAESAVAEAVESESEGGDNPVSYDSGKAEESRHTYRLRRKVEPVIRLSYDEPGVPTNRPITLVHRGLVIRISYET
ncbi:interleukin-1 receptor accessory protein-like 1-A [Pimephales promelas]|nr:interleukin-1 receptor accessory protein-like 1-A [Pimephales promelas]